MGTASAAWIFLITLFLWSTAPGECKVYYGCGAVLNPTDKDLILSPGFPNNYLPGSHCLWQIFVPAGSSIVLETLDFDVFDSSGSTEPAASFSSSDFSSHSAYKRARKDAHMEASMSNDLVMVPTGEQVGHPNEANNQINTPETWDKSDKGMKPLLELQNLTKDRNLLSQGPSTSQKVILSTVTKNFDDLTEDVNRPMNLLAAFTSRMTTIFFQQVSEGAISSISIGSDPFTTSPPVLEVCLLDVLYITDLVTYSSRFCGSNSPLKNLTFGSPVEMIEVVLELITATNRGRGFAILFTYHNQSLVTTMGVQERRGREGVVLLAVVAATISFALVLLLVLCLSYRQKICPKREHNDSQMTTEVSGIQNTALEVNELQLVVAGEDLQNRELESASQGEEVAADVSEQTPQDEPSSSIITVTDSNSDEVFVISHGNKTDRLTFKTNPLQEGNLKRSITSPASVSDWLTSDYTNVGLSVEDKANEVEEVDPGRPRTWSVRTFHSLLPQLQMKWLSRTSSGSFTKLVDNGSIAPAESPKKPRRAGSAIQIGDNSIRLYSESSDSNASYPLTQSAQLQRKLPSCNLKRIRPYFGLPNNSDSIRPDQKSVCAKENHSLCQKSAMEFTSLSKTISGNGIRVKELTVDLEKPNAVFVICEEADDQQPLVFDDQLSPPTECLSKNHDIGFKAADCSFTSKTACSHLSPWIQSSEVSTYQCVDRNVFLGPAGNLTTHCTTAVGRLDSAVCAKFPSPPIGLVTE